ncbi:response regulator [Flavobacterium wongokense]|uniref:response regulator n=1 Tax=Flavobacterium wongokense TaxID=2910674 RepID=UPI001F43D0D8|nr:response regulator [Flavobacterium sp. WG47]MCF6131986.1 response regulator [Flavobacterium sp. WG47]
MKKITIFYADDDEDDLMLFNEAIEKISTDSESTIHLHLHKNGESLIENIKKNKQAQGFVFMDINMPFKSGFQLLEEIRKNPETKEFPVIMYSTSSNQDNIDKSQDLGANYYVVKPYEFNELLKIISDFIKINWENHKHDPKTFLYK